MTERRKKVIDELVELTKICNPVIELMKDEKRMKEVEDIRDSKTLISYLQKEISVSIMYLSV